MSRTSGGPIAIVGMACRFPGAPNVSRYWRLIREGRNAFGPPPADRWSHAAFFSDVQRATDRYYAPHGAFVDDVRSFAALEYGIPPRRVEVMDPQQRLTLEAAWHALQDAGYAPAIDRASGPGTLGRGLDRRRVGTFLGLSCTEYRSLMSTRVAAAMMASGDLGQGAASAEEARLMASAVNRVVQTRAFTAAGALGNMSAAVVAQELDLGGPAFTVDAACASALVAIHDAVTYLRDGQIDAAVAGGVYLNLSPENLIAFSRIGAISAKGVCRPFDADADGFVQGEGVGMVMLKRLEDAVRDHDRVYAVIRGSGCNNDGRGDGPMSPRAEGQEAVIAQAWADAGVTADQIGYVEAHGTGTTVGDKTELGALRTMIGDRRDGASGRAPVPLGSAKGNIGHTMSAAGVAGLIKAVLAIHHKTIPPLANWSAPHPLHQLDDGTFTVPTVAAPWRSVTPRRATVSSFGFGGTNGHVVLEEAPARGSGRPGRIFVGARIPEPLHALPGVLVVTSADDGALLARHCAELAATLDDAGDLAAIAHTLNLGRKRRAVRVAIVARTVTELAERLQTAADALSKDPSTRGALHRDIVLGDAGKPVPVAFLAPGQGMQKVGMLRDWLHLPPFAEAMAACERDVLDLTARPLTEYIWAPDATEEALTDTQIAQPAMFAIGVAVAAVLARYGITPAIVLGHSLGEFTAAALAGGAPAREALRFVASRGKAMSAMPGDHGAMAAVMAEADAVAPHLPPTVVIANRNHPRQNVISGPTAEVERALVALAAAGLKARRIPVSHAFHSPMLESVQDDVERGLAEVAFTAPTAPMASCIHATPPTSAAEVRAIFARHATSPVEYVRGLQQCWDAGARIFVQLGSGATLTAFARGVVPDAEILSVASESDTDGLGLLRLLARLAAAGHRVDLTGFGEGLASLPPTPFTTQQYWAVQDTGRSNADFAYGTSGILGQGGEPPRNAPPERSEPVSFEGGGVDGEDIEARVLRVVSKVSAFPLDALRVEQRLLDDLGFDSLMLAELSTKLGEAVPGFTGIPRSLFATSPTVADLVRHVEGAEASSVALTLPDRELALYRPVLRAAPLSGHARATSGRVLVKPSLAALRALTPGDVAVVIPMAGLLAAPHEHGVLGFVRALSREWADHKVVLVYGTEADAVAELAAAERDAVVHYEGGARFVVGLAPHDAPAPMNVAGQRILVSGGTGWLGQVLARALIDAGAEVVLLGSRQDPGDALANLGASARYVRADLRGIVPTLDGIDGIVHAAGVLADGPVGKVDGTAAWDIKVNGLLRLVDACPGVRWVSAIGSYAAFFGNAFQTEYAAANDGLVGLLPGLAARDIHAQVQVWGPWADSTMVGTVPLPMRVAMREDGVVFVDTAQGARAFVQALGIPGEVVLGLDLPAVRRSLEVTEALSPEMPWLRDHALMGRPTVPMAMVLEWAIRLGAAVGAGPTVHDLTLFDGVVVEKPLVARLRLDGERFRVLVGSKLAWEGRVGSAVAAEVGKGLEIEPSMVPDLPTGGAAAKTALADFYSNHTFHGPLLQGIVSVGVLGDQHVTGKVRVGSSVAWGQDGWTFSPLAIDSALQLCGLWAFEKRQRAGFPVKVRAWTQRHVTADEVLDVAVTFEANTGDRFTGTVVLRRANGEVVAVGEGVEGELRALPGELAVSPEFTDFARFPAWIDLDQRLQAALMLGIDNPYFKVLEGTARDVVEIAGKERVHFSGYNYLGFSGHPYVEQRVTEAVRKYGTSVSASRVASGERPIHLELEQRIAAALGVEESVVFTAGHATNVTTVGHLFGPKDLILHDELIHDSVFQGMKLSGATRRPFPHGDTAALARLLEQLRPNFEKALIVVEGVYSMDGDICDLPAYVALKKRHKCFLMVDEAHSFGVVGERGYGVSEHFGVPGTDIDIWMGTLSKSLSSCGGYIAGSRVLVQLLKYTAPGFIYSAGLSPANTMAAIASLELMEREPENVKKLQANARFFYAECQKHNLDTGPSAGESGVCPVIVGNSFHALLLSDALMKRGVNVQPILYPAVADNASRLRFFLSSLHSEAQLAWTAGVVAEELGRIRAENGG